MNNDKATYGNIRMRAVERFVCSDCSLAMHYARKAMSTKLCEEDRRYYRKHAQRVIDQIVSGDSTDIKRYMY